MAGAIRSCAGGVVFCGEEVFILMTDKGEWVMPKGVIRNHNRSNDVALWRVEDEAGIHAEITTKKAAGILQRSEGAARAVLNGLVQKGYLEADNSKLPFIYQLQQHIPD